MRLPPKYKQVWEAAIRYQDKQGAPGHARIVTEYALILTLLNKAKPDITIPAAILHDIGWSRLSKREGEIIFDKYWSRADTARLKRRHEIEGAKLAKSLLEKIGYPPTEVRKIVGIINGHDTYDGFRSREDGVVRDADRLWRFSRTGFLADLRRFGKTPAENLVRLKKELSWAGYFCFPSSRAIALAELKKRHKEAAKTQS